MESVHFLNIEYFLLRTYNFFHGTSLDTSGALGWLHTFWIELSILGLTISFFLFLAVVWVRVRLVAIEHQAEEKHQKEVHNQKAAPEESHGNPRWERIIELMGSAEENNWRIAILEADSMLFDLLNERGYSGETMAEKLKGANPLQFTTLDLAWQAHKVRNALAHLGEAYPLTEREARATIDLYGRVFEEFSVI